MGRHRFALNPLRQVNIRRWVCATPATAAVVSSFWFASGTAAAQGQPAQLPTAADAIASFSALSTWLRQWDVPSAPVMIDPAHTSGASVTIRSSGTVLGTSAAWGDDGTTIWQAARSAWIQADAALPFERDALRQANIRDAAAAMTVELELAGAPMPLIGQTFDAATAAISPGRAGLAARLGSRYESVFPGAMLSANLSPALALQAAVGSLGLPPVELGKLRSAHDLTVYRFSTRHLMQTSLAAAPVFLYRGDRVVQMTDVTVAALRLAADRMAANLLSRAWPGDEPYGLMGDYLPQADRYEPLVATPLDQSLGALALARYAATPGADPQTARSALRYAQTLLQQLAIVAPGEADPLASITAAAMWVVAWDALAHADANRTLILPDDFDRAARSRLHEALHDDSAWDPSLRHAERALIVLALAVDARRDGARPEDRARAERALRDLFRTTPPGQLPGLLPWLGWAELFLAGADESVPAGVALRQARSVIWDHQVDEHTAGANGLDLIGGTVFTRSRTPLPTAQSLRLLAFLATALGDQRLTDPDQRSRETSRLRRALRFLLQLSVDPDDCARMPGCGRALGGVRQSVWNSRIGLESTALGLLTLSETLRVLDSFDAPLPSHLPQKPPR